jgi:hypothetical protein
MSTAWMEDLETEGYDDSEGEYDSEAEYDSEGEYDSEDARSDARRRRARARRVALARRRMITARGRRPSTAVAPTSTPRQTVAAIRNLDLETKVGEDSLRQALDRSNQRANRATYATVASVAVDQAFESFQTDFAGHEFVRAGLRFAPLLLLSPARRRPGFEGFALDPRVIGGAAIIGIVAADKLRDRDEGVVDSVTISPRTISKAGGGSSFSVIARDKKGKTISDSEVSLESTNPTRLDLTGRTFTPKALGAVDIKVTAGAFSDFIPVTVET